MNRKMTLAIIFMGLAVKAQAATPWIRMSRGACYGTCPVYELRIYRNGIVTFDGKQYVPKPGAQQWKVSAAQLSKLEDAIRNSGFDKLDEHCCDCREVTDAPSTIMEIDSKGVPKRIYHYHGCRKAPLSLEKLEDQVDEISGARTRITRQ